MKLSLVVPVYYEQECIGQFVSEVTRVLADKPYDYEVVFVDDGSRDATVERIKELAAADPRLKLVVLSYNHGKQAAVTAGIKHATGDALLYMDPDLQDPPEEIPRFVEALEQGYDVVYGVRRQKRDSLLNRMFSALFWWVLDVFTGLDIPKNLAVMRIFNRTFAERFLAYEEQNRFIEGIFMHIGLRRSVLEIEQRPRFAGVSKFNFRRRMGLALNAIFDYSEIPLKVAVYLGLSMVALGATSLTGIVVARLFFIHFQTGWPSVVSIIIFAGGVNLFFTGVMAIYVGRIYREVKRRPLYSVQETVNLEVPCTSSP